MCVGGQERDAEGDERAAQLQYRTVERERGRLQRTPLLADVLAAAASSAASTSASTFRGSRKLASMPPHLQAVYYRAPDGSQPVDEFIERLPAKRQVVIDNQIARINLLTPAHPHLPFPHSSQLEGELRELRCHYGRTLYRIIYRRSLNLVILLHVFRKDTGVVPEAELAIARQRWEDFRARMSASRRVPPRAAGRDAP